MPPMRDASTSPTKGTDLSTSTERSYDLVRDAPGVTVVLLLHLRSTSPLVAYLWHEQNTT